jgi:hypothetical protein
VIVPGNTSDGVMTVRKPVGLMTERGSVGGSKDHAEALKLDRGGGRVESSSYFDPMPLKADKVPVIPGVDTDMMTPSVCLIPPEEGQSGSLLDKLLVG